jgi:hypothetical protein
MTIELWSQNIEGNLAKDWRALKVSPYLSVQMVA